MASFALLAEGVTDQAVIENILHGCFQAEDADEPVVTRFQPPPTLKGLDPAPGGWTLVFRSLQLGKHREALQNNDFVIVHIDTDVCEEPGYEVSRRAADGRTLSPEELIGQVKERLVREMGGTSYANYAARVIFAISVDSVECWLLPLLYDGEPAKRKAKTAGCLNAANEKLRSLNRPTLSKPGGEKILSSYESVSGDYARPRHLQKHRSANPSLEVFVKNLEAVTTQAGPTAPLGDAE